MERWTINGYELKYNPKSLDRSKGATESPVITASGMTSNVNLFYDTQESYVIDFYDPPSAIAKGFTVPASTYLSIAHDPVLNEVYFLKSNATLQKTTKTGTNLSIITLDSGTAQTSPVAITKVGNEFAVFYQNAGNPTLIFYAENGTQNRKFTYSDADVKNVNSLVWDSGTSVYLLNPYGKIFEVDKQTGTSASAYQMDEFDYNKTANLAAYSAIHMYDGNIGFLKNKSIFYYIDQANIPVYALENLRPNGFVDLSSDGFGKDVYIMSTVSVNKLTLNLAKLDVNKIRKSILDNGILTAVNEQGISRTLLVRSLEIRRIRSKQESRFEMTMDGRIL